MYSAPVGIRIPTVFCGSIFQMSVRSTWFRVLFKSSSSLLILLVVCLDIVSLIENGVLKPPTIVTLFIFLFNSVSFDSYILEL